MPIQIYKTLVLALPINVVQIKECLWKVSFIMYDQPFCSPIKCHLYNLPDFSD